jgi:ketosteroid isomerase-like protein
MRLRLLPAIAGLGFGLILPVLAQDQNAVDPEVRQQIEALIVKADEAFNNSDAAGCTAVYTQDAVEVLEWETAGGAAIGQQAIEKRYAGELGPSTHHLSHELLQAYAIGILKRKVLRFS